MGNIFYNNSSSTRKIGKLVRNDDKYLSRNSNEQNTEEYFKLIKLKLRKLYEENQNSQFNIAVCLDKKDFDKPVTCNRISMSGESQKFIHWKAFLIKYLEKQASKGVIWALDFLELVKEEVFLSENKWLSLFFWQEFEMRTKPKCLLNIRGVNDPTIITMKNENISDSIGYSVIDHFGGSFGSIHTEGLSLNDPTHEYKLYRSQIKSYIAVFKEHIFDCDHPINIVVKIFVKLFSHVISEQLKELYQLRNAHDPDFARISAEVTDELTRQLQKFILKLQCSLRLMYAKTINYYCFIEEKDEFINLVTCLVFKEGKLYEHMLELYQLSLGEQIEKLGEKLDELKGIKPGDLGIGAKFSLDENTLTLQKQLLEERKNVIKNSCTINTVSSVSEVSSNHTNRLMQKIEKNISTGMGKKDPCDCDCDCEEIISPASTQSMKLNIRELNSQDDPLQDNNSFSPSPVGSSVNVNTKELRVVSETEGLSKLKRKQKKKTQTLHYDISQGSYIQAIKLLKSIKRFRVPFEKMLVIASISSEITECVNQFWKDMEKITPPSFLNIEADELMTIFIYIIIKSQMSDLLIHSKLIKQFTSGTTRSTMIGYYFTTLEASLIYIMSVQDKKDFYDKERVRESCLPDKKEFSMDRDDVVNLSVSRNFLHNLTASRNSQK